MTTNANDGRDLNRTEAIDKLTEALQAADNSLVGHRVARAFMDVLDVVTELQSEIYDLNTRLDRQSATVTHHTHDQAGRAVQPIELQFAQGPAVLEPNPERPPRHWRRLVSRKR